MEVYKSFVAFTSLIAILFLAGCGSFRNVTKSDPYFKDSIGKTICSKGDLYLDRWRRDDVRFPDLQEFRLTTSSRGSVHKPVDSVDDFVIPPGAHYSSISVKKGPWLTIKKVYYYNVVSHQGHIVMATANSLPVGTKLIEITDLFDRYAPHKLLPEFGEFC